MASRVLIFVSHAGYGTAYQAASLGVTAQAMGDEVVFVFSFDALRQLARGTFGQAMNERETAEVTRAEGLGAATPAKMLSEARGLGARLLACDTTVRICGLTPTQLVPGVLDEVAGLPSIWRLSAGARTLTF